jgi:tetratricopeptide (TPR) repeat protein
MKRNSGAHVLTRFAQSLIILTLVVAPFPFGSVGIYWVFMMEMSVCFLLVMWVAIQMADRGVSLVVTWLAWPVVGLLCFLLLTLAPLDEKILEALSATSRAHYQSAADMLAKLGPSDPPLWRISLTPFDTTGEILKLVSYVAFFFLCLNLLRHRRGFVAAIYALTLTGIAVAILGIAQNIWSNGKIYWVVESGSGTPFGPFANHNHFAGYIELVLGLSLGLLAAELFRFRERSGLPGFRGYMAWIWDTRGSSVWLLLVGSLILIVSLAVSLSRGGVLSFAFTSVLFGLRSLLRRRSHDALDGANQQDYRRASVAAGLVVGLAVIAALSLTPRVRDRWNALYSTAAKYRFDIWKETASGIAEFPITGAGLGSFRTVFPRYKASLLTSETTHAESEYLEWIFETGFTGSALLLLAGIAYSMQFASKLSDRRNLYARSVGMGALFSLIAISFHNLLDFSAHIPSNALTASAIAAIGLVAVSHRRGRDGEQFAMGVIRLRAFAAGGLTAIAIVLALAALLGLFAYTRYESLRLENRWDYGRSPAARGTSPEDRLALISQSLRWSPWNDHAYYARAVALEGASAGMGLLGLSRKREMMEESERSIHSAIRLRPASAEYWAYLGRIEGLNRRFDLSRTAYQQAIILNRNSGYIHCEFARTLLLAGNAPDAAAHFRIARNYASGMELTEMLEALAACTPDANIWQSILRRKPGDLRSYAAFLRNHGLQTLAAQAEQDAELLERTVPEPKPY